MNKEQLLEALQFCICSMHHSAIYGPIYMDDEARMQSLNFWLESSEFWVKEIAKEAA